MPAKEKKTELAENSKILFSVFRLPHQNAEEIIEPADELVNYLEKSLGKKIPQYDKTLPVRLELTLDPSAKLENEEFAINASEKKIEFRASTVAAVFHAVYYFLEKAVGIRWLWPGEDGEVVPKLADLSFPCGSIREKPDFKWRAIQTKGAIYGDANGIDWSTMRHAILGLPLSTQKEFELWKRRNRMGGLNVADGHRWSEIAPTEKYGKKHPEYYAVRNGKRDSEFYNGKHYNQPCLSNKEIVKVMADYACSRFEKNPSLDVCSIAFNDGSSECECKKCKAASFAEGDAGALDKVTNEINVTGRSCQKLNMTDLVFANANNTAKEMEKKFPDKKLLTLLYSNSRFPARKNSLSKNVVGQFCIMGNSLWNKKLMKEESSLLKKVAEKIPELGIYEYYSNGKWPEIFRLFPRLIEKTVNLYYNCGARYFATQPSTGFAVNGLNFYFLAKLLWNRKEKTEELLDDYCAKGFGKSAPEIKKYFSAIAGRWQETASGSKLPGDHEEARFALTDLYPRVFLKDRKNELGAALKKANGKAIEKRIRFLQKGLEHTRLYCNALRETSLVYKCIPKEKLSAVAAPWEAIKYLPEKNKDKLKRALKAWENYWGFVEKNMGKFIFCDFWVNYRPGILGAKDQTINAMKERLK